MFNINCKCDNTGEIVGLFSEGNFNIVQKSDTLLQFLLKSAFIVLDNYMFETFTLVAAPNPPATPLPILLDYANISDTNEVKLLAIVPEYDKSYMDTPSLASIQWKFASNSEWSNLGPFMFLTGSENLEDQEVSNKIGPILLRNNNFKPVKLRILIGI